MKIVINATVITDDMTGIGYYAYYLLKKLLEIDEANEYIGIFAKDSSYVNKFNFPNLTKVITRTSLRKPLRRKLWEGFILPFTLKNLKADVYFSPSYVLPVYKLGIPMVVTIHDFSWWIYPETKSKKYAFYMRHVVPYSLKNSDMVIVDSKHTASDLRKFFKFPPNKIKTVYLGINKLYLEDKEPDVKQYLDNKYQIKTDYILAVGTLEKRKNILRLIKAFISLKQKKKLIHKLVLVGKFKQDSFAILKELIQGYKDDIIFTGYVDSKDLAYLYFGASIFVYPSIYEGFGLPPLEAMSCGVPVATSNISSMPEILQEACIYFDPYDVRDISDKIYEILDNKTLRNKIIEAGYNKVKNFNWDKTANDMILIFKEIASKKGIE